MGTIKRSEVIERETEGRYPDKVQKTKAVNLPTLWYSNTGQTHIYVYIYN